MYFFDLTALSVCNKPIGKMSVALGTFDGVHLGHREILKRASESNLPLCAVTFSENPFGTPMITLLDEKLRLFADCGAKYALVLDFSEIVNLSYESFFRDIIIGRCDAKYAYCGFNYRFGKNAAGTPELLCDMMADYNGECICIPPVCKEGDVISSSRIRNALTNGDIALASRLLGRRYSVTSTVVHGNEIGRKIGFPTMNFDICDNFLLPENGVYITTLKEKVCITDIGIRPTVDGDGSRVCETHIINEQGDYYGQKIKIEFHKKIRNEMKFSSLSELSEKLSRDKKTATDYFINQK